MSGNIKSNKIAQPNKQSRKKKEKNPTTVSTFRKLSSWGKPSHGKESISHEGTFHDKRIPIKLKTERRK